MVQECTQLTRKNFHQLLAYLNQLNQKKGILSRIFSFAKQKRKKLNQQNILAKPEMQKIKRAVERHAEEIGSITVMHGLAHIMSEADRISSAMSFNKCERRQLIRG